MSGKTVEGDDFFSGGFRRAASDAIDRLGVAIESGDKELAAKLAQEALQIEGKRRMLEDPSLHMEFTADGKVLGLFRDTESASRVRDLVSGIRSVSSSGGFADRCSSLGLDPSKTSLHALECRERGLNPEKTSMHALECTKLGLDPNKTSINELTKAGSNLYSRKTRRG